MANNDIETIANLRWKSNPDMGTPSSNDRCMIKSSCSSSMIGKPLKSILKSSSFVNLMDTSIGDATDTKLDADPLVFPDLLQSPDKSDRNNNRSCSSQSHKNPHRRNYSSTLLTPQESGSDMPLLRAATNPLTTQKTSHSSFSSSSRARPADPRKTVSFPDLCRWNNNGSGTNLNTLPRMPRRGSISKEQTQPKSVITLVLASEPCLQLSPSSSSRSTLGNHVWTSTRNNSGRNANRVVLATTAAPTTTITRVLAEDHHELNQTPSITTELPREGASKADALLRKIGPVRQPRRTKSIEMEDGNDLMMGMAAANKTTTTNSINSSKCKPGNVFQTSVDAFLLAASSAHHTTP